MKHCPPLAEGICTGGQKQSIWIQHTGPPWAYCSSGSRNKVSSQQQQSNRRKHRYHTVLILYSEECQHCTRCYNDTYQQSRGLPYWFYINIYSCRDTVASDECKTYYNGSFLGLHDTRRISHCTWLPAVRKKPSYRKEIVQTASVLTTGPLQFVAIDIPSPLTQKKHGN